MEEVVEGLEELAGRGDSVSIGDALDQFGHRSFGPFMLIPAVLELTPIGGVPGVPTFLAVFIAFVALQLAVGRDHIWMPDFVQNRSVSAEKLHKIDMRLEKIAVKLDRWFVRRLQLLTGPFAARLAAGLVILLCCSVPPLEVIPFASSAPMLAIAAIGLALTVRDGLLMVAAAALSGTTIYLLTQLAGYSSGE